MELKVPPVYPIVSPCNVMLSTCLHLMDKSVLHNSGFCTIQDLDSNLSRELYPPIGGY